MLQDTKKLWHKKNGHQKDIEVGANKLKGRDFSGALLILPMTKVLSK